MKEAWNHAGRSSSAEKTGVLLLFFVAAFLYYFKVLNLWFFLDDPAAIVSSHGTLSDIFLFNSYSNAFYTPLLPLSFKPDVFLFGLNPFPYHLHNLTLLVSIAFIVYLLLRRHGGAVSSAVSASIILFSAPALVCIAWITLRQYLYSTLFSLLAISLFIKHKPEPRRNVLLVSSIMVLSELAFMGKEQFMTLPLVLFVLSGGTLKQRFAKTFPYFLVLIAHLLLRWHVLGGMGGYLGMRYDPRILLAASAGSVFTTSKVLFGFAWAVVPLALPLIMRPRELGLSALLWLVSLSISFVTMAFSPSADTYRYWFVAVVLFSFLTGMSAATLKKRFIKVSYLSMVLFLFLYHSLPLDNELTAQFREETSKARALSESLVDSRYRNAVILLPDDRYIVESFRIYHMADAYRKISGAKIFPVFYPLELLSYYPAILRNADAVYALKGNALVDMTASIGGEVAFFRSTSTGEKPEVKLLAGASAGDAKISLRCPGATTMTAFTIRRVNDTHYVAKDVLPYLPIIELKPLIKNKAVEIMPAEILSYGKGVWYVGDKQLGDDEEVIMCSCNMEGGKHTALSDFLHVLSPRSQGHAASQVFQILIQAS